MKFNKTALKNGVRVITAPMPGSLSVTVMAMADTGSNYEKKEENGISHLLEHMLFKGTARRPKPTDISHELDSMGAESNAFTGFESTGYHAKVDSRHFDQALDIIADMYLNPTLDAAELEKEKGVVIEEMRMYRDRPDALVDYALMELTYGDQPAGRKVIGEEKTVRAITRDHLAAYHRSQYAAEATTVIVAGGIDEEAAVAAVERAFGGMPRAQGAAKPPVRESQSAPAAIVGDKATDQTHLIVGVRSLPVAEGKRHALLVLASLLGGGSSSRLFTKLREEMGVCYYVYADNQFFADHSLFNVAAGVDNKRVDEVIGVLIAELKSLTETPVSDAELAKVKSFITGKFALSLETSDALANYAGINEALQKRVEAPADAIARIKAVTADELLTLARSIFVEKNLNLALVGPYKKEDAARFKNLLSFGK